jgi:hypothetical protein
MSAAAAVPRGIGLYLALVQFFFALGWIVYAAYLPRLAAQAGIEARWVPWILVADQIVFVITDLVVGVWSDRAARVVGRIGYAVLAATVGSTLAFVLLPWVAPQASPALFLVFGFAWAITSSALRAPPLTLLGRYAARPAQPMLIAIASFGLGIANATAPYVAVQLRTVDPRWPFVLSGVALAVVTLGMVAAERSLARRAAASTASAAAPARPASIDAAPSRFDPGLALLFVLACVVGAIAFQWHTFVASAPLALRRVSAAELPVWLPMFWVGFNLCLVPAGMLCRRIGAVPAMAIGAEFAMIGVAGAAFAPSLGLLVAAQLVAGAGWAMLLCAAFSGALVFGHTGREGMMSGALSSTLALAAAMRIGSLAVVAPAPAVVLGWAWLPALGFLVCALLLLRPALTR